MEKKTNEIVNMRIKSGFEICNICGENIIVAHGLENIDFTKVITLNESAADVWNGVAEKDFTIEDMVDILTDLYEVSREQATDDAQTLLNDWKHYGLVCE